MQSQQLSASCQSTHMKILIGHIVSLLCTTYCIKATISNPFSACDFGQQNLADKSINILSQTLGVHHLPEA